MAGREPHNLEQLLDLLASAENSSENRAVSVSELVDATGRRSFGPLLLVAGVLVASPLSGIPGFPTLSAAIVFLIAVQLLAGREQFWLPGWLLRRKISRSKLDKALGFLRAPARWVDRLVKPRFTRLTEGAFVYVTGAVCALLALAMPPLEMIPLASSVIGMMLAAFGLALIARDGLFVTVGLVLCVTAAVVLAYQAL